MIGFDADRDGIATAPVKYGAVVRCIPREEFLASCKEPVVCYASPQNMAVIWELYQAGRLEEGSLLLTPLRHGHTATYRIGTLRPALEGGRPGQVIDGYVLETAAICAAIPEKEEACCKAVGLWAPFFRRISFVHSLSYFWLAATLGSLGDPRPFYRMKRPFRAVRRALGLTLKKFVQVRWPADRSRPLPRIYPFWCWWKQLAHADAQYKPGGFPVRTLWQTYRRVKVRKARWRFARAAYQGTEAFLKFLYWNWMDAIYFGDRLGEFFSPDQFFVDDDDKEAFYDHFAGGGS